MVRFGEEISHLISLSIMITVISVLRVGDDSYNHIFPYSVLVINDSHSDYEECARIQEG